MKKYIVLLIFTISTCFLTGCANTRIVKMSPDTYMLTRQDNAGIFGNAAKMKADVIREATEFAESQGKVAIPLAVNEKPMVVGGFGRFGTFASIEYQFRVVEKDDSEARRTSLVPKPDIVIDKTEKISKDIRIEDISKNNPDLYSELIKLGDLLEKNLITQEEFEKEKQRLLNRQ